VLPNPSGRVIVVASNEPAEESPWPWPDPPGGQPVIASRDDANPQRAAATGIASLFRDLVDAVEAAIRAQP
jgi:hypothetical protein